MQTTLQSLESTAEFWRRAGNLAELWWTRHGGAPEGDVRAERLRRLVEHARRHSPFYAAKYGKGRLRPAVLPPVHKAELMSHFDAWCTDREVRRCDVERFLADRSQVGGKFLGRYHVWKSSGTSGTPGIFVQDAAAMAVYDALVAAQLQGGLLGAAAFARLFAAGGRAALVVATGDHFASITSWEHLRRGLPASAASSFSVLEPLATLVGQLNEFRPAFVAGYPSVLSLLAAEQRAGRLRISPALLWSAGEFLAEAARIAIEQAFDCRLMNEYGASECLSISYECAEGWMHVNDEWVVLEPVDARGAPTPPGEMSHTVLVTNLANWVQPIIRYDLGDRVQALGVPCACGDPHPAIRIEGRTDAMVELQASSGKTVRLPPLALSTVVEDGGGGRRFQLARRSANHLLVRLDGQAEADRAQAWRVARAALRGFLASQGLDNVRVSLDARAPKLDDRSGKLHAVVDESGSREG